MKTILTNEERDKRFKELENFIKSLDSQYPDYVKENGSFDMNIAPGNNQYDCTYSFSSSVPKTIKEEFLMEYKKLFP